MNRNQKSQENKTAKGLGSQINYAEQTHIPPSKLRAGDIKNRIEISISDNRTWIYAKPDGDIPAIRNFWEQRLTGLDLTT